MSRDTSSDVENPFSHLKRSREMENSGNLRSAESSLRAAVSAADQLPLAEYKQDFLTESKKYQLDATYQSRPGVTLQDLRAVYYKLLSLPFSARLELASFYAQHGAIQEANDVFEEAFSVGVDALIQKDEGIAELIERGHEARRRVKDVVGPENLQQLVSENFEDIDTNSDGFLDEAELRRAQFDLDISPAGQGMIRHLLYHYLDVEESNADEWGVDVKGISRRDVECFEKKTRATWRKMSK